MMNSEGLHLETSDVAAYLDRALSDADRARLEAHLAGCADCRREIVEVSRVRRAGRSRRRWLLVAPAAAAAVLAIVLLRPPDATGPTLRDGGGGASGLVIVAPAESAAIATPPAFVWRSAGAEVSYRFSLSDASGDVLWSAASADTTLTLPATMTLLSGRSYFWYVDALLPDGRSATSGIRRFVAK